MAAARRKKPASRLRRSDCSAAGMTRVGHGRGFAYVDPGGQRVSDQRTLGANGRIGPRVRARLDRAVLDLLGDERDLGGVEGVRRERSR